MANTLEERVLELEAELVELKRRVLSIELKSVRLGPAPPSKPDRVSLRDVVKPLVDSAVQPVDETQRELTSGKKEEEVPDYRELKENGQQKDYVVLSAAERAKGFVRPVRRSYVHVGPKGPQYPLRDLTPQEHEQYDKYKYDKYEEYPEERSPLTGRYWTLADLNRIDKGCRTATRMSIELAETYARKPDFYGGTFCVGCRAHLALDEFVWEGTEERLGT